MKLVFLTYHFEFADAVEEILERHGVDRFVRVPMIHSRDRDGRHYGSKVFPGSADVVQAQVPDGAVDALLEDLERFRQERDSHRHLEALVLGVKARLGGED